MKILMMEPGLVGLDSDPFEFKMVELVTEKVFRGFGPEPKEKDEKAEAKNG